MAQQDADLWDERYRTGGGPRGNHAVRMMERYAFHIEALRRQIVEAGQQPLALDVACGAGGAVCWLAEHGWHVTGVDLSQEALNLAQERTQQAELEQHCTLLQTDLDTWRPEPNSVHLIVKFFFLDRVLMPALRDAIQPGGLFLLETMNFHRKVIYAQSNPAHLLGEGELLELADAWGWSVVEYHSNGSGSRHPTDAIVLRRHAASR